MIILWPCNEAPNIKIFKINFQKGRNFLKLIQFFEIFLRKMDSLSEMNVEIF